MQRGAGVSSAKRLREARRRKGREPFATLRCDDLLSAACALDPAALRVWLLLHAAYKPPEVTGGTGEAFISFTQAVEMAGHGRSAIATAFRRLRASGHIVLVREGSRPRAQGAAAGEAAVWNLPSRSSDPRPKPPLPAGVERPEGKVRWNAHRLRADIRDLSPAATKVLAFAVAHRRREKDGRLAGNVPFNLAARPLARALDLSASGVAKATGELVKTGRLLRAGEPSGRRPAAFTLAAAYTKHEPRGGALPLPPKPMVTTGGPRGGRNRAANAAVPVPAVAANA